ncbi:hypothetical protein HU200_048047 [Digitaria exilis]|uniref:non-specific serine/threonine protein kinase n=1 Tax=Digitaria exilis TaxID=1010633 RepID=A0A835AW16_9POAL|nr:hypothetical protein HU200_048047 [Digitaria exilis]
MKVTTSTAPVLLVFLATISHSVICSTFGNDTDRLSLLEFKNAVILDPQKSLISWNESTHFCRWEGVSCSSKNPPRVTAIDLSNRGLVGLISPSLGNLTFLRNLSLATNRFTGQIPESLGHLRRLQSLYLSNNSLQGIIPSELAALREMQILDIGGNRFSGGFSLFTWDQLSGSFPSGIANLTNLIVFGLDDNLFTGSVPQWLGGQKTLQILSLSNNNFTGYIPSSLSNLSHLIELYLHSNQFIGNIPPSFGTFQFPGTITTSYNNLHGSLPNEIFRIPTINQVEFAFNNLNGELPTEVGNLESLKLLNLSHNMLSGSIPVSLGDLELLQELDLAFNNLSGKVPTKGIFKNLTAVQIDGNLGLCGGALELRLPKCPIKTSNKNKHKLSVLLKVVIPLASMATVVIVAKPISLPSFGSEFPKVSYKDLARATNRFSTANLIVAIKVFCLETMGAQKSFIAECNALRNVRHRNLVPILTACLSIDSSGNLCYISLAQRLSIAVDVSDALEYLHHSHQGTVIHCDLKPSNILLDGNMTAHVGDFGLARLRTDSTSVGNSDSTTSVAINGTIGYVAPECAVGGQVSTASDVYSFGVILLEIFIRRRPTDEMFKDGLSIAMYTEMNIPDKILQIIDPQLVQELGLSQEDLVTADENAARCLLSVMSIGLCCTKSAPSDRISMQEVSAKLHAVKDSYLRWY